MTKQCVTKLYRQHTTVVTGVPALVGEALELTVGDYLVWEVDKNSEFVQVSKVVAGGKVNVRNKGNSDRKD